MGRFSAPDDHHHNNNDVDSAEPMDWTMISDDEHDSNVNTNDDVMMLARMRLDDDDTTCNDNYLTGMNDNTTRQNGVMVAYDNASPSSSANNINPSMSASEMMEIDDDIHNDSHLLRHQHTNDEVNTSLLQITQQCLQQLQLSHDYYSQQQYRRRRRNKKIFTVAITIALFTAIVLKWHAPPPPRLTLLHYKKYYLLDAKAISSSLQRNNNNIINNDLTIPHHETWVEFTSDVIQLLSATILYTSSVIWYVMSNSFTYAALDVRDSVIDLIGNRWGGFDQLLSSSTTFSNDNGYSSPRNVIQVSRNLEECPIRIQAACNHHTMLPRGAVNNINARITEGLSTEESLRQSPSMVSLPSQKIALQLIAEGIDSWGEDMVENISSKEVIHRMASFINRMDGGADSSLLTQSGLQNNGLISQYTGRDIGTETERSSLEWILPPAKGFLFIGPEAVGKRFVARRLADWLFTHCSGNKFYEDDACVADEMKNYDKARSPVLEIIAGDSLTEDNWKNISFRHRITEHIQLRKGLGSVIIIHHIEELGDDDLLFDIINVLNGKSKSIPLTNGNLDDKNASCDGSVFLLTSEEWGTKRIFQMIQHNDGLMNLPWKRLISGIRREIDSHLQYGQRLNSRASIVPFLPFQRDDLLLVIQKWFQDLSDKYQGVRWVRLDVSFSALEYVVGTHHIDYLDLYHDGLIQPTGNRYNEMSQRSSSITFSTNGANGLSENSLYSLLMTKLKSESRRRPNAVAFLDVDEGKLEYIFSWYDSENVNADERETQWRMPLTLL